ncbi:serum response factor-like isoform X4 [Archocentrus centrarchus]|uniref:serum response factor-like isoform X4 n=1 Tax=Archocentrus centrarchus TaxID=63155 RepID=UPI0011EA19FE|nr:serum response factor-like isoform X4 [Archocentrus centrarchus]
MLAGSRPEINSRTGPGRMGSMNKAGPVPDTAQETEGGPLEDRDYSTEVVFSGSDQDSDSGEDEDTVGAGGDRRGVKRERSEREVGHQAAQSSGGLSGAYGGVRPGAAGVKPGKKTRGRVKIKMEFIDNKLRRYTTFSKRKTGIMKKAYELSTLTGTQVLLLVASETGHVYTFATRKLQPMITSETGKALIQTCLNSPDSPPRSDPSSDQRMSATGFEETDLTYQVSEADGCSEGAKDMIKPAFSLPGSTSSSSSTSSTSSSASLQVQTSAPSWQPPSTTTNGTLLKTSAGVVLPGGFTLMSGPGISQQLQTIQVQTSSQQAGSNQSISDIHSPASSTASLPVSIVSSPSSSSSSVAGHMMYPGSHTVMYAASSPSLGDGSLTVLNTFPPAGHAQSHDPATVPQVFLTSLPPVAAQIPVSAVQLHPMVISQQSSNNLTELQVVSLDVHQSKDD